MTTDVHVQADAVHAFADLLGTGHVTIQWLPADSNAPTCSSWHVDATGSISHGWLAERICDVLTGVEEHVYASGIRTRHGYLLGQRVNVRDRISYDDVRHPLAPPDGVEGMTPHGVHTDRVTGGVA